MQVAAAAFMTRALVDVMNYRKFNHLPFDRRLTTVDYLSAAIEEAVRISNGDLPQQQEEGRIR